MKLKMTAIMMVLASVIFGTLSAQAQTCEALQSDLRRCEDDLQSQIAQQTSIRQERDRLLTELNELHRIRDTELNACQRDVGRFSAEIGSSRRDLHEATRRTAQVEFELRQAQTQMDRLDRERFLKWECVVKDRKYAIGGYGADRDRNRALQNAIADAGEMARKHGTHSSCFKVYRP